MLQYEKELFIFLVNQMEMVDITGVCIIYQKKKY